MSEVDDFLQHYGVKGMKWGQRKSENPGGVSNKVNREAKKDAEEFTRAKLFYGEGAGTRRKLIKAKVEARKAKDPGYKEAFDHHVNGTDFEKRASQAKKERRRKDATNSTRKGVRGTVNILNGNSQAASAATALVVGGALYAHKNGIDRAVMESLKSSYSSAMEASRRRNDAAIVADLFKRSGL